MTEPWWMSTVVCILVEKAANGGPYQKGERRPSGKVLDWRETASLSSFVDLNGIR